MRLDTLTLEQCELVRQWRNDPLVLPMLRTKTPLSEEQQERFYWNVVCNSWSTGHHYYALIHGRDFVGMGGLTYRHRVPGEAEISLIIGPDWRRAGLGRSAVDLLREEAKELGIRWIVGEVYDKNPARAFWVKQCIRRDASARFESDRMFFRMRVA